MAFFENRWLRDMLAGAVGSMLLLVGAIILVNRYLIRFVRLSDTGGRPTTAAGFLLILIGLSGVLWFLRQYRGGHV